MFGGEAPADFHAWHEVRLEARHGDTDEADEFGGLLQLRGVEREAVLAKVRVNPIDHLIAFVG